MFVKKHKEHEEKKKTTGPFVSSKSAFELPNIDKVMENLDAAINKAYVKTIGNEDAAQKREELKALRDDIFSMMSSEIQTNQMVAKIRSQLTKAHSQCGCMG